MTNHIKSLLSPFLKNNSADWKIGLLQRWSEIMGPMACNVTIVKVIDDTVLLGVYDSSWLQELYLLSDMIINTINQNLDQPRIKKLRFKQIKRATHAAARPVITPDDIPQKPIELTRSEQHALEKIENDQLRSVLKSFLIRCRRESER